MLLLWALPLRAAETTVELDPSRSTVAFSLAATLHTVHGSFQIKRGTLKFDSSTGQASGEIVIDVVSGNTGNGSRDQRMHKEILESAKYPEAIFTPTHVTGLVPTEGEVEVELQGSFRIHGTVHELTVHCRTAIKAGQVLASTVFTIPYVQWGIKNPSTFLLRVSDKLEMRVEAAGRLQ